MICFSEMETISYDSDMDILVLASDESKIRQLAKDRKHIPKGQIRSLLKANDSCRNFSLRQIPCKLNLRAKSLKFSLVTRPGPYCRIDPGERVHCGGKRVKTQEDTCSFCGPFARMFMDYGNFIDLFLVNIEPHTRENGTAFNFGYTIEEIEEKGILDIPMMWSVTRCKMMGLEVPCPHNPAGLLDVLYNERWEELVKLYNGETGNWEAVC
ncbi:hypothetical protein D915_001580 [Fasciola hepatica]|uniref:Uncharacterized protein n=1 Tax=Fasciola hepatica TaxID=6192 RepID=A0A4E0RPN0_FASHE|nr:hypothetical protein D915_001580 [Fasciola hepatica]